MRQWQGYPIENYPDAPPVGKLKTHHRPQKDIMQTILPQLTEVGKIYIPKDFPDAYMKVKEVFAYLTIAEADSEIIFSVKCCAPEDSSEAAYIELTGDEWHDQGFTPAPGQTA